MAGGVPEKHVFRGVMANKSPHTDLLLKPTRVGVFGGDLLVCRFERGVGAEVHVPMQHLDGSSVVFLGSRFDFERGAYPNNLVGRHHREGVS